MSQYIQDAIDTAPTGTSGLVVAPWDASEVYGVAADWSQASAPVYTYTRGEWSRDNGYQVADWQHKPSEALEAEIIEALIQSGDGDSEAASMVADATAF
jgi:hypothetical protein